MNNYDTSATRVFTPVKYSALAYGSPKGLKLQETVEDAWEQWLRIVEGASWLRSYAKVEDTGNCAPETPAGRPIGTTIKYPHYHIASLIYSAAVWGYGVEGWIKLPQDAIQASIRKLRKLGPSDTLDSTCTWHAGIYRGCGLVVPVEFGDLDDWLEPMWLSL